MNTLEELVSPALLQALGWTLLHSLWQGALAAAVLAVALLALRRHAAAVRYRAAAGALGALVLLGCLTFGYYYGGEAKTSPTALAITEQMAPAIPQAAVLPSSPVSAAAAARPPAAWLAAARHRFDQNLPWLVLAWGLGLLLMSLRLLGGLLYMRRLRLQPGLSAERRWRTRQHRPRSRRRAHRLARARRRPPKRTRRS